MKQIPEALFTLVNLARLSLAGTKLGPAQGSQLEAALRLDTLTVDADAVPPPAPLSERNQPREQQQQLKMPIEKGKRGGTQVTTLVPLERLPNVKEQVRATQYT